MDSEDVQQHFATRNENMSERKNDDLHTDIKGSYAEDSASDQMSKEITFPEGGTRAWLAASGAAGVLFCTFGYVNALGRPTSPPYLRH